MKWKRIIGWTLGGLAALLFVAFIAGYLYLRSSGFQQFALRKIVEQANSATGGRTEIGSLDFSLSTLTAHLYNITVHGTEGPGRPPLLHADKLTVRLKIISALRRDFGLREVLLDRPVVHLQVGRDGRTNLPAAPPGQGGGSTSVFDMAIDHAQLTGGEINYNDRKTPLEADLYNLGADIHFASLARRYEGDVSYQNGKLSYAQYAALPHSLNLRFNASPDRLGVDSATFKLSASAITLHAQLTNYANPIADGDYRIQIHAQDFAAMSAGAAPAGDVTLDGKLYYQAETQSVLRDLQINGKLAGETLSAMPSGNRIELRKLQGTYQLAGGRLRLNDLTMESFGGRITATADMQHLDTTPESHIRAALHDISLRALQQSLARRQIKNAALSGRLNGAAEAAWKGGIDNLRVNSDLTVRGAASGRPGTSAGDIPVNGAIHAVWNGPTQTITLRDTSLRIPSATLTAQGDIGDHSSLTARVTADDLHQLVAVASSFRPSQSAPPAVSGSATLNAVIRGSIRKPTITGQMNAQNLKVEGSEWKSARLDLRADASQLTISNGVLISARQGQATVNGKVALRDWSYDPSNAIRADVNVQQLRMVDLQKLANQHYPVFGDLSAKLSLEGSQLNPVGSGTAQLSNARIYDEPVRNLALKFDARNGAIVSTLNMAAPAGNIDATLSYTPKTRAYKVRLDAPAIDLKKLQAPQARNLDITGAVSVSANGEGTLDNPQLVAVVQVPRIQLRQSSVSGLKAEVRVADHYANLTLDSKVSEASVKAHGRIALSGDYYTEAAVDTGAVPLDVLMATYGNGAPRGFSGQTEFHATLKGPLKQASQMEAHLSIPLLKASYQSLEIGIAGPVKADYANSVITLQPAEIRGTGTSLRIQGRVPIGGAASSTLTAQGSLDARILQIVSPDVKSSGMVTLDVRASGTSASPIVQGKVELKNIALATIDTPVGIENLNGAMDITSDHLRISSMTGQVGGGQVSVGGSIAYRPSVQFNLALQAQGVRLRYPDGLRSVLDANLAFSGTSQDSTLNGRVLIDSLAFTPDFDLVKFSDQFSTGNAAPSQPGFADTISLAIGVQSQENLNATSSQVSIAGRVALQVKGTAANPVITGRTSFNAGELFYRNLRYQLQKGVITFDDPNETHPVMNVSVTTTVEQYNLTLSLRGPLDNLTTSYVSDPPLATADVINLIARGKTTQESAASSQSTDSMIASQAAGQVSSSVQKLAGISSLQIDPTLGGNGQNPSARVAIQQRVTKNLLFTFSTDVSQPGSEAVQGEYQINKHWSISMSRDQLGGVSVDGKYHSRF